MSFDVSQVVTQLGEEAVGQCGEPLGLSKDQSNRVARALAAHMGLGQEEAIRRAAADTGLDEEVVAAMLKKLGETARDKVMEESGINNAIDGAKDQAMAALSDAGAGAVKNAGGMLGRLFGRR